MQGKETETHKSCIPALEQIIVIEQEKEILFLKIPDAKILANIG